MEATASSERAVMVITPDINRVTEGQKKVEEHLK
jgi:hypothetical protein